MKLPTKQLTVPQIGMIAITRGALGIGLGLLLSNKLNADQRKAAGVALVAIGIITTVPIAVEVFGCCQDVEAA